MSNAVFRISTSLCSTLGPCVPFLPPRFCKFSATALFPSFQFFFTCRHRLKFNSRDIILLLYVIVQSFSNKLQFLTSPQRYKNFYNVNHSPFLSCSLCAQSRHRTHSRDNLFSAHDALHTCFCNQKVFMFDEHYYRWSRAESKRQCIDFLSCQHASLTHTLYHLVLPYCTISLVKC